MKILTYAPPWQVRNWANAPKQTVWMTDTYHISLDVNGRWTHSQKSLTAQRETIRKELVVHWIWSTAFTNWPINWNVDRIVSLPLPLHCCDEIEIIGDWFLDTVDRVYLFQMECWTKSELIPFVNHPKTQGKNWCGLNRIIGNWSIC